MSDPRDRVVTVGDNDGEITLGILNAVEDNSRLTQRSVAGELGIALGLANAYLKRCVRKGLVKVQQVPSNRYAYYLTPQGFAEKSRLTSEYLSSSFQFFRRARQQCEDLLQTCEAQGHKRLGLVGVSDLAEVLALAAMDSDVALAGVVDPTVSIDRFAGMPVTVDIAELAPVDALVITVLKDPQAAFDRMREIAPGVTVFHVPLLRITEEQTSAEPGATPRARGDRR